MVNLAKRCFLLDIAEEAWMYKYTWLTLPSTQNSFLRNDGQEVYIVAK
jgi:hypothetical protein